MKKITFLLIFICAFANGQNIKNLYTEKFEKDWKVFEDENYVKKHFDTSIDYNFKSGRSLGQELVYNKKKELNRNAERISRIFIALNINLAELDSLSFIEQRSKKINCDGIISKGVIIANDSIYGYIYDFRKGNLKIESYDYFKNSENDTIDYTKNIIKNLILSTKINYLDSIAKVDKEMFDSSRKLNSGTEFEILIYNKKKENELRRIYLQETFVRIIDQN